MAIEQAAIKQLIALKDRTYLPSQQDIEYWVRFTNERGKSEAVNCPTRVLCIRGQLSRYRAGCNTPTVTGSRQKSRPPSIAVSPTF